MLFTITGFLVLPPIVKAQLQKRLSAELGRPVTVGKVRVNPYAFSITIENLEVGERAGPGAFFGWRRLYVNFGALASLTGDWVLREVALDGFHARVIVNPDGTLNFSDLVAKAGAPPAGPAATTPPKLARPVRVDVLKIAGARVDFSDNSRPRPFSTVVGPLDFTLARFRTSGKRGAPYSFEAVTEAGERFTWKGTLTAAPFRSAGEFGIMNIDLPKYAPY
ncbi:MAG TPA: DUF748 domain-containing protein [Opitutaceae bacterium]|nr:DUF748 domain-containing protein [Opitutaceae bacterium]